MRTGFNGRLNYSNFHPNVVFLCCYIRIFRRENGVEKNIFHPPTFIDLLFAAWRDVHKQQQSISAIPSRSLVHVSASLCASEHSGIKKSFFLLYGKNFHSIFLLSFPFPPTEFYCFRHELSHVVLFVPPKPSIVHSATEKGFCHSSYSFCTVKTFVEQLKS